MIIDALLNMLASVLQWFADTCNNAWSVAGLENVGQGLNQLLTRGDDWFPISDIIITLGIGLSIAIAALLFKFVKFLAERIVV